MAEKIKLYEQRGYEIYMSEDLTIVFRRIPPGKWGYFKNEIILDTDRYRNDLAERNNFQLVNLKRGINNEQH